MRVVIAPDAFKGTATAAQIALALASGWRSVRPGDDVLTLPMADGGEGTLDAFKAAYPHSREHEVTVPGPDDRPVAATWLELPDGRAVVELASTSGITLLEHPAPETAHTLGFGRAISAALDSRPTGLLLGIGGSASTDGGLGMLLALGLRTCEAAEAIPCGRPGAIGLDAIGEVDTTGLRSLPAEGAVVLGDVNSPLLGPSGAAAVFGEQKGVAREHVHVYEARLARWAARFPSIDPATPGAGAAGGTGFGLLIWGARIVPGAEAIAGALRMTEALQGSDLVITGEGRFDGQSSAGKVAHTVRTLAAGHDVALVAGAVESSTAGFCKAVALRDLAAQLTGDPNDALRRPQHWARQAGAELASQHR